MKYGAIATGSNESLDTAKHIFKEGIMLMQQLVLFLHL